MPRPKLALHGGTPVITEPFRRYNSFGPEETEAARSVVESGVLSQFLGAWHDDFYGGPKVQAFETAWAETFGVKHAVTFNSWTSGLVAAVGALDIAPGDEVIVSPWTMTASAAAILHWNAIPVFADIDPTTFCLDPAAVEAAITPFTRAIMAVDIFGQSADMTRLRAIADDKGLKLISDTAQSPLAQQQGRYAGTLADIGGFSLNYHKHIHTGEGGVAVTDDDSLAERMRLIRNHAEAVVEGMGVKNISNMVGHNFRLGEIESAIGLEQLKKLPALVLSRQVAANRLHEGLRGLAGLVPPRVAEGNTHAYYTYAMTLQPELMGVPRELLHRALLSEGVQGVGTGYQNLHLLPLYQKKIAFGPNGFPWTSDISQRTVDYSPGTCPVAEELHRDAFMSIGMCSYTFTDDAVDQTIEAFRKVWNNLDDLR